MGAEPALRLGGVHFSFPGRPVFAGLELTIAAGSHCAVLGASGCGKTTLLQLAAGLLRPQRGAITAGGAAVAGLDPSRGLVFQDCALFPWRSALGNAAYGLARQGLPRAERRARALALLARLGLGAAEAARHPHALSGGQRQRVAIARALAVGPRLLLLDEPSAALDEGGALALLGELRAIQATAGFTCLTATHRVAEALAVADRCLVLAGAPARLVADLDLREADRSMLAAHVRALLAGSEVRP